VERLEEILQAKGLRIFDRIDFSGDAKKAGLEMSAAQLFIFGNPKAGTPIMIAAPTVAIDFPLKILVSQVAGQVWVSYNSPEYLRDRHNIPDDLLKNISGIVSIVESVAK
jgi:uncharacterized protein (DUF302 family)